MNEELPRLSRLTAILLILQSKKYTSANEIAEKFEISKRTVYRDMRALEEAGVPIYADKKGYSLVEGFSLPPVMFTEQEANALITIEKIIELNSDSSLIENYKKAIAKIKSILKNQQKDKADLLNERIAISPKRLHLSKTNYLLAIEEAITSFELMQIQYTSLYNQQTTTRIIEPQALYLANEKWIMIAWCRLRSDFREFRIDQIVELHLLQKKFEKRNFKLTDYFFQVAQKYYTSQKKH